MNIFSIIFVNPTTNILVVFYHLLTFLHIPFSLGFSIILLTGVIRLILYPFTASQIRSSYKMQKLTPHVASIKEKHKDDKKRQQEEMMKLYKEHGVNPAAGCLPVLIQLPVIWGLYTVLQEVVKANGAEAIKKINEVLYYPGMKLTHPWDTHFFGLSLSAIPSQMIKDNPLIILVPIVTGILQYVLSKMMLPEDFNKNKNKDSLAGNKKGKKNDDFQTAFQTQSVYIFPVMIGFFSFSLPLGLSLYWNTFTVFGILQQYLLVGGGSISHWFHKVGLPKK